MERLTIKRDEKNVFQSMYYAECKEYADGCGVISCPFDCPCEIEQALFDRLGAIEDILGDDYDLDRLRELVEADKDGRCVVQEYKSGDPIWVVERDEIDEPDRVSGYVFVAHANGVVIVHPYIGECGEIDAILYDCITETRDNMECDLEAFPFEDCYHSLEAAEAALKGDQNA